MNELVQITRNSEFYDRIFPIVLDDARIYNPVQIIEYIKYWEDEIQELEEALKGISSPMLPSLRKDIDLYAEIRNTIISFTDTLRDMNTLTAEMHRESGFGAIPPHGAVGAQERLLHHLFRVARVAGQAKRHPVGQVLVHGNQPAERVRVAGGGRCDQPGLVRNPGHIFCPLRHPVAPICSQRLTRIIHEPHTA